MRDPLRGHRSSGGDTGVEAGPKQFAQHVPLLAGGWFAETLDKYARSMQAPRQLPKPDRQRLVASLVARRRLGSQHELQQALRGAGCDVTQATISRDVRELGLEKTRDVLGRPRYMLPERARRSDPRETLGAVLGQFGRTVVAAQNIVVIQSELGSAPAIARALDRVDHAKVLGTLAGDDTCLVITRDPAEARAVVAELSAAIE
jgi:transcriptional regulator of arginine metabolism